MINDIRVAFAFLTRITINHGHDLSIARSARWFPLVGAVIGGATGIAFILLNQVVPALRQRSLCCSQLSLLAAFTTMAWQILSMAWLADGHQLIDCAYSKIHVMAPMVF